MEEGGDDGSPLTLSADDVSGRLASWSGLVVADGVVSVSLRWRWVVYRSVSVTKEWTLTPHSDTKNDKMRVATTRRILRVRSGSRFMMSSMLDSDSGCDDDASCSDDNGNDDMVFLSLVGDFVVKRAKLCQRSVLIFKDCGCFSFPASGGIGHWASPRFVTGEPPSKPRGLDTGYRFGSK